MRYQFFIVRPRDGKQLAIGSHCIRESVPFLIAAGAEGLPRGWLFFELGHAEGIDLSVMFYDKKT